MSNLGPSYILGKNVVRLRELKGLEQRDLIDKTGISRGIISSLENGHGGFTSKTIEKLCDVLDCRPVDLFAEGNEKPSESIEKELRRQIDLLLERVGNYDVALFQRLKEKTPKGFLEGLLKFDEKDFQIVMDLIAHAFASSGRGGASSSRR